MRKNQFDKEKVLILDKGCKMIKKLVAVVISVLILSLGLSLIDYTPQEQRDPDVYYMDRFEIFIFAAYIYLIFFIVIGLPSSLLIDQGRKYFRNKTTISQYLIGTIIYSLWGVFLGALYHFVSGMSQFNLYVFLQTISFWFIGSFVYFHVLWALERDFLRNKQ